MAWIKNKLPFINVIQIPVKIFSFLFLPVALPTFGFFKGDPDYIWIETLLVEIPSGTILLQNDLFRKGRLTREGATAKVVSKLLEVLPNRIPSSPRAFVEDDP